MKKFLLTLIVTMLAFVGTWAQASHSSYKFNAASNGTLFMDANDETPATYAANDPCVGTYYLKVNYQHTSAPATKDGPKTFNVKDYYVDGVCTYGQEYVEGKGYTKVDLTNLIEINDENKGNYVESAYLFTQDASTWVYTWDGTEPYDDNKVPVVPGSVVDPYKTYYGANKNTTMSGQTLIGYGEQTCKYSTAFKLTEKEHIYTLANGIYTQIPTTAYDENETYYVVAFTAADPTAVAADANFETSKLYDLSGVSETIYHKNGTSYDVVVDGAPFIDDNEYYVDGTSYQPCTPADLAALGYATSTTTYYDCDVTSTADQITITYHAYGNNNFLDYFTDCADELSNHANVVVKSNEGSHSNVANVTKICEGIKLCTGVVNLVLSDVENPYDTKFDYNLSALSGSSVKRVILPNAIKTKFSDITNATPGVVLEMVNKSQWEDFKKVIIYSPAAGSLAAIKDYHYYSDDINAATRQEYFGEIGASDVEWFNGVNVSELDLSAITHDHDDAEDAELTQIKLALHELTNSNIEYVVFPDLEVKPEDPLYTDFLTNCPSVIAVGQYTSTDKTFTAYSKQTGKISLLTEMLADLTATNVNIKTAKISGTLNAKDLNGGANVIDANGHYTTSGGTGVGALVGVQLDALDLESANFYDEATSTEYFNDMTISALGIFKAEPAETEIQSVILPKSDKVTIVPEECLKNLRGLRYICIPYNIKEIHTSAFEFCDIEQVTCTDALGNLVDYGIYTYALPAQLTLIQTNAFNTRRPQNIHDIYVLARIAPQCETHAFSTKNTWGDGGFKGNTAHPISRANYDNNGNLITVLHFPAGISDEQKKNYTDVTRKYSLSDETGATNDDGDLWLWPHHGQLYRAYDQAIAGVTWDAWTPSRDANDWGTTDGRWDPTTNKDDKASAIALAEGHIVDASKTYDYDYVGWHEFVLTGSTNYNDDPTDPEPKSYWNFSKFKKQDWYTLCVPFNMTKTDLARVFGALEHEAVYYTEKEIANAVLGDDAYGKSTADVKVPAVTETVYPRVVTLAGVTRNATSQHIQIQLSDNLVEKELSVKDDGTVEVALAGSQYKPVYTNRTGGDEEVIVEANKPYFILPYLPDYEKALANAGKRAVEYTPLDPADGTDAHVPYTDHHVNVLNAEQTKFLDWQDNNHDDVPAKPYTYYFVGTYLTQDMPLHAYYLGSKSGKSTVFRNVNGKTWTQLTTVIGGVASEGTGVAIIGGQEAGVDVANYKVSFTPEEDFTFNQELPSQGQAKSFSYIFVEDDNQTTGIMMPNEDGSMTFVPSNSKVYNVNGQFVGTSLENLNKGLYIVNGKKFVVK